MLNASGSVAKNSEQIENLQSRARELEKKVSTLNYLKNVEDDWHFTQFVLHIYFFFSELNWAEQVPYIISIIIVILGRVEVKLEYECMFRLHWRDHGYLLYFFTDDPL